MKALCLAIIGFGLNFLFGAIAFGEPPRIITSGFAVVVVEGSQIYAEPDLDAPVIAVAKQQARIPISKGTRGEFAKFYRTRVDGKVGWILILDVKSEAEAKKFFTKAKAAEYKPGPFAEEARAEREARRKALKEQGDDEEGKFLDREPLAFSKSIGLAFGISEYKESINGVDRSTSFSTYGLKITGPDVLLSGPLMDVNIFFHYGAPSYYDALSATRPSGFVLWVDANLLLPIVSGDDSLLGIGAGPVLILSNIHAMQGAQDYGMWRLNMGANIELTAGIRFGQLVVRADAKYILEKTQYRQFQLSVGTGF